MKKHILLTTTAMLLSAITLNANADSNSAQLHIEVDMVEPFEIIREKYLGFGKVLASGPNKTVIVTTDGKLDPKSTATMMSKASHVNYSYEDNGNYTMHGDSFNEAVFRIKGSSISSLSEDTLNVLFLINFADTTVNLMSDYGMEGGKKCGTVSDFTTHAEISSDGDALLHIGGTFTTSEFSESSTCYGETTISIVFNDEYFEGSYQ